MLAEEFRSERMMPNLWGMLTPGVDVAPDLELTALVSRSPFAVL